MEKRKETAKATSAAQSRHVPCCIHSDSRKSGLSLSHPITKPFERRQCARLACGTCSRFEDIHRRLESSNLPVSYPSPYPHNVETDLLSIGDQFTDTARPTHIDLSECASEHSRVPDIVVSTNRHELQQSNKTPLALSGWGSSSDYNPKPTQEVALVPARSVKSDTDVDRSSNALRTVFPRPVHPPVGRVSEDGPHNHPEDLIVRLCCLTLTSHFETLRLIDTSPDVLRDTSIYSLKNVFEGGFTALQKFWGPLPPSNFEEIYCLVHISLASVRVLHEHETFDWNALEKSLMRLGCNIKDEQGRTIYPHVLKCIWQSQCSMPATVGPKFTKIPQNDLVTIEGEHTLMYSPFRGVKEEDKALTEVKDVLDRFESMRIWGNRTRIVGGACCNCCSFVNAQQFVNGVLRPLQQGLGTDINMNWIKKALEAGTLLNNREAEIMLVLKIKTSNQTSYWRESAVREVIGLFDNATGNPNWRSPYYIESINGLLATALEINKERKESWNGGEPYHDLLCTSDSRSFLFASSHSHPSIPPSSTHSMHRTQSLAPLPSSRRTSMSLSEAAIKETLAAAKDQGKCPICGKIFKNIPDQKHNLLRHLKTKHGENKPIKCPDPNCELLFSNKFNCGRHFQSRHRHSVNPKDLLSPRSAVEGSVGAKTQRLSRSLSQ